jgi:pimeloyl-ACP methyl ester carboxylesterase
MRVRPWRLFAALLAGALLLAAILLAFPSLGLELWRRAARVALADETGFVTTSEGRRIAWASLGEGEPLLLVHGLRGELTIMLPLARALAERGHRVLLIDLPGHGRSPYDASFSSIEDASRVVLDAAESLGLGREPTLVGHSLGAWIVAWAALSEPTRVGRAVLLAPPGLAYPPPPYPLLMPQNAEDVQRAMPLLFAEPRSVPWPVRRLTTGRDPRTSLALLRSASSGEYLLDGLLEGNSVPMLVLHGTPDGIVPVDVGREIARRADARFVELEHVSHMLVWEDPERVASEIESFL